MIVYELTCASDHRFEAWFRDGEVFEKQTAAGEIACPVCGDTQIARALTAPHVRRSGGDDKAQERAKAVARQVMEAAQDLRKHVESTCDDVGDAFCEEARRIHYGEAEPRGIYGEATDAEAHALKEEGVPHHRIPWPRRND